MPAYTSPTSTILSILTDQGRDMMARALMGQLSFQISGFKAGREGYEFGNPVIATAPFHGATQLDDPIHPPVGIAALVALEQPLPNVLAAVCRINRTDGLYGLGEVGLYVRVVNSHPPADQFYTVGSDYLFALAHLPLMAKTDKTVMVFRFVIAL